MRPKFLSRKTYTDARNEMLDSRGEVNTAERNRARIAEFIKRDEDRERVREIKREATIQKNLRKKGLCQ